jgi:hypothetical protein
MKIYFVGMLLVLCSVDSFGTVFCSSDTVLCAVVFYSIVGFVCQ